MSYPNRVVPVRARPRNRFDGRHSDFRLSSGFSRHPPRCRMNPPEPPRREVGRDRSRWRGDPDLVRSYVRAAGRVRPSRNLDLVTLVTAAKDPDQGLGPDERRVLAVCGRRGILSISEIAAHLDMPPSLATIVVADLLDSGHLTVPVPSDPLTSRELLEQVLAGLRALDT